MQMSGTAAFLLSTFPSRPGSEQLPNEKASTYLLPSVRRLEPSVNGTFEILLLGWGLQSGLGSRKPASRGPCTVDATELLKRLRAGKGLGT